jgi:hypothetical protein
MPLHALRIVEEPSTETRGVAPGGGGNVVCLFGAVDVFRDTKEDGGGSG